MVASSSRGALKVDAYPAAGMAAGTMRGFVGSLVGLLGSKDRKQIRETKGRQIFRSVERGNLAGKHSSRVALLR